MIAIGAQADMLYFPYNSEVDSSTGERDRLYDSRDWADYFRQFIGNGVYGSPASGLRVESLHGGMVLGVRMGAAFINGHFYLQKRDFEFAVQPAHLTLGRRDIVICRHDIVARTTQLFYVPGAAAAVPQVPPLVRTDDVFDLQLCVITVNPNVAGITQANILDTRPNNAVCGFVTGLIQQADTTALFEQYEAYLNEQIAMWERRRDEQFGQWGQWTREKQEHFKQLGKEIELLILAMETKSFTLINNNFDDWSVRRGCELLTQFAADGSINESIRVSGLDFVMATRATFFKQNGDIETVVTFYPWEGDGFVTTGMTVGRKTFFEDNGDIREEIL